MDIHSGLNTIRQSMKQNFLKEVLLFWNEVYKISNKGPSNKNILILAFP